MLNNSTRDLKTSNDKSLLTLGTLQRALREVHTFIISSPHSGSGAGTHLKFENTHTIKFILKFAFIIKRHFVTKTKKFCSLSIVNKPSYVNDFVIFFASLSTFG